MRTTTTSLFESMRRLLVLLVGLGLAQLDAQASQGDDAYAFQTCLASCVASECPRGTSSTLLGVFPRWSCEAECRYECMWREESSRRTMGMRPVQYYGKWPFKRILGMQEPLSTIFSVLNAVPHAREMVWRRDRLAPKQMPPALRVLSLVSGFVAVNTWVWSAAFHARDTWITERLDYHFATLHMIFYLWYAICRTSLSHLPRYSTLITTVSGVVLGIIFSHHVWYMNFVSFDYGYNMLVTAVFVGLQIALWVFWAVTIICLRPPTDGGTKWRTCALMVIKFQLALTFFALFEAFDFPPFFDQLDAHAIWHGATIALGFYWYRFREMDAQLLLAKDRTISL